MLMEHKRPNDMSAAQVRKIKKPMIERRRRDRINDSLNQLKTLVLEALDKDESRYTKMEKADVLEMTVRHLKAVQRRHNMTSSPVSSAHHMRTKYRAGYSECAKEVCAFLHGSDVVAPDVQARLMGHLAERVGGSDSHIPLQRVQLTAPLALPMNCVLPRGLTVPAMASPSRHMTSPLGASPATQGIPSAAMLDSVIPLYVDTVPLSPRTATSPCCFAVSPREGATQLGVLCASRPIIKSSNSPVPMTNVTTESVWRPW